MTNTTDTFETIINNYSIVIPLIQRDYAQGRESEKDKAKSFLEVIKEALVNNKIITLDFIYGKIENKDFIPLDGQQRLTTLFLLHWYACFTDQNTEIFDKLTKFTYKVRDTTTDFLKELTNNVNLEMLKESTEDKLSDKIKNCNWFFNSWENDPSIKAMLYMLDLINDILETEKNCLKNLNKVKFEFLKLEKFNLTDELYVKMNARGTPLTNFENFKSLFDENFKSLFDKDTTDNINKFDGEFFTCFQNLTLEEKQELNIPLLEIVNNNFYSIISLASLGMYWSQLKEKQNDEEERKTQSYELNIWDLLKENHYKDIYTKEQNVKDLISFLDYLSCINKNESTYVDDEIINGYIKDTIKEVIKNNLTLEYRSKFYAIYIGVLEYQKDQDRKKLQNWIRVTFNLINNQLPINVHQVIISLEKLRENYNNLYENLQDPESILYFTKIQREEECIKAKIILDNPSIENSNIEKEIIEAENIEYLNGRIGFLLYDENNKYLDSFVNHKNTFSKLWDFAKENNDNNHEKALIRGALLTFKNYLPKVNNNEKYIFCSFSTDLQTKNRNWRNVFETHKNVFQNFLSTVHDKCSEEKTLEYVLSNIIQSYLDQDTVEKDWRFYVLQTFDKNNKYVSDFMTYTNNHQHYVSIYNKTTHKLSQTRNGKISLNVHESILRLQLKEAGFTVDNDDNHKNIHTQYVLYVKKDDKWKKISYEKFDEHAIFNIYDYNEDKSYTLDKANKSAEEIITYLNSSAD